MVAKVMLETIKEKQKECQKKVLKENTFYTTEGERATIENEFMINDKDYIKYLKLCFEEYKKAGLKPRHWGKALDYPYWQILKKAEEQLIKWGYSQMKKAKEYKNKKDLDYLFEKIKTNLKYRDKVIDLTLRLNV
jgi:hypothetical protein